MTEFSDDGPASDDQIAAAARGRSGEPAKPLSPAMLDWMHRFQEAGVRMATDEDYRKTIAARLF